MADSKIEINDLIKQLQDEDPEIRKQAADSLAEISNDESNNEIIEPLIAST